MEEKYFIAKITVDMVDSESGKIKKQREEKLVRGYSPTPPHAVTAQRCQLGSAFLK